MADKHFFKPLLPGFHRHLTIPKAFFLRYTQGRNEETIAKLRSDASEIIWEVKIEYDDKKLTDGWKEFALAHDLRVGDIAVFKQESDMSFHVTLLGPSCCEIQYGSCLDDQNNLENIQWRKKVEKNPRREEESSSSLDPSCFVAFVSFATLRHDILYIPKSFARENGLDKKRGEIVLMNGKGKSWTLDLRRKESCGTVYIRRGWRIFCRANGLKTGGSYTFKLIQRGQTPVLRLLSKESDEEEEESSEGGDEIESLSTESENYEENNHDEKGLKKRRWKATSSPSHNRFVTLTVTPDKLKKSRMILPVPFTMFHGINEETKMTLVDKNGENWCINLRGENTRKRIRLVGGLKEFFRTNSVKIGDTITLELIREENKSCVLKFCSE